MRPALFITPAALALALSACASGPGGDNYNTDLQELAEDCRARGGVLAPTGQQSGQPARDNVCKITAQPARAPG